MSKRVALPILMGVLIILNSCGSEQASTPAFNYDRADSLPADYVNQLGSIRTGIEITAKLFQSMSVQGLTYVESHLLPANGAGNYGSSDKQALAIGAYCNNIMYAHSFGQNQTAIHDIQTVNELAEKLNISEAFSQKLIDRLTAEDSTIDKSTTLTKAYLHARDQLFSEERAQLATMMVIGGWVEGLYLSAKTLPENLGNAETKLGFWELCESLDGIIDMASSFSGNSKLVEIANNLERLKVSLEPIVAKPKGYTTKHVQKVLTDIESLRSNLY